MEPAPNFARRKPKIAAVQLEEIDLASGIWCLDSPLTVLGMPLGHRMTVIRLSSGDLWVHSPVEWTPALGEVLSSLGDVRHVVAPSCQHDLYLEGWSARYRTALFWAAPGLRSKQEKVPFSGDLVDQLNSEWAGQIDQCLVGGMPGVNEFAFFHPASRSLIVADLAFNLASSDGFLSRTLLKMNGCARGFGPNRSFRWMIKDRTAFAASLEHVMVWDFDRIIVGHGEVVERNGKHTMAAAFGKFLGLGS
ncbi:MAG: DUF4336 domain-containing protein [Pedosphaera sp.]|nr:DUF4336 domain-containing protein [Pedosphaera sp.]